MDPTPYLPKDWDGNDVSITCPCGNRFEWDGSPPCSHENPLRAQEMI